MVSIKKIIIIYNPNSTGDGKANAEAFKAKLEAMSRISVTLQPTEAAGHAEKIAQQMPNDDSMMVISSSGDGGYHEVVNGVLSRGQSASKLITGLLPSGNANDHYTDVHHGDAAERIIADDVQSIDLIKVTIGDWTRYAHSYVGIGITPHIGEKLTEADLNPFNEIWLTIRHFFSSRPVKIKTTTGTYRYDSLVFSNVGKMSKYITLSKNAKIDDGKFEMTGSKSGRLSTLLGHIFKASTVGLTDDATHLTNFSFTSSRPLIIQLDGEVFRFKARSAVAITVAPKALKCIV
jgi:diacylglycerol kinase (ATP)